MPPISFGLNASSLRAQRQLAQANSELGSALQRLSSGQRINKASDDAAGLAVSTSLGFKARVYTQGLRNINDGVSVLNLVDGTLGSLGDIVVRLKELSEQSANGPLNLTQRRSLNSEANSLVNEFNRLVYGTQFNKVTLLDTTISNLRVQLGLGINEGIDVSISQKLRRNISNGVYDQAAPFGGGNDTVAADFNNDGRLDVVQAMSTTIAVQLGTSSGFSGATNYNTGTTPQYLAAADFNGDGNLDLVSSDTGSNNIYVRLGTGSGTFGSATAYSVGSTSREVVTGDFNNDGKVDIGVTLYTSGAVGILNGAGNGTFGAVASYSMGGGTFRIATGDINGDGNIDLVTANETAGTFTSRLGNGNGTFGSSTTLLNAGGALTSAAIAIGDINNDGIDDVVYGNSATYLRTGKTDGTLSSASTIASTTGLAELSLADYTGDGYLDVIASDWLADGMGLYKGNGSGGFTFVTTTGFAASDTTLAAGDINNDGVLDLLGSAGYYQSRTTYASNIANVNINTRAGALSLMSILDETLTRILNEQGNIGAGLSRLQSALDVAQAFRDNNIMSQSRILDADIAQESSTQIRANILQQTGAAVLAQANLQPNIALQLLQ